MPRIIRPASSEVSGDFPASLFPLHFPMPYMGGGPSISPRSIPFASIPPFPELVLLFWSPAPAQCHHFPFGHAIRRSTRFLKRAFYQKKKLNLDWFQMHLKSSWGAFRDRLSVPIIITNLKPEIPSLGKNHPPAGKTTRGEAQAHPACPGAASQVHFPKKIKRKIKKNTKTHPLQPSSAARCAGDSPAQAGRGGAGCGSRVPRDPAGTPQGSPSIPRHGALPARPRGR